MPADLRGGPDYFTGSRRTTSTCAMPGGAETDEYGVHRLWEERVAGATEQEVMAPWAGLHRAGLREDRGEI